MATINRRLTRFSGNLDTNNKPIYDTIHHETGADVVIMADGTTLQETLAGGVGGNAYFSSTESGVNWTVNDTWNKILSVK